MRKVGAVVAERLGDFEILRELGRGGMGVVFEARQVSLNRKVALKVLSAGLGLTPKAIDRFRREAEAAARLHHTNIVRIYATGEADGTHFYAMELIDGPSLDHVIRQMAESSTGAERNGVAEQSGQPGGQMTPLAKGADLAATGPYVDKSNAAADAASLTSSSLNSGGQYFDTVARMIAEVADALEHAHQNGVVHRDIKPSNLLLSSSGRLSVNDFGLARMLEQPGMTMTGEFVGTPAYMSPEQITAGRAPLNHRTDIYSLGATLYELLTLQRPFKGERRDETIAQIMHKDPPAPRRVNARVPMDLETICLKCLEKDPDRRYQTAGALADDLRRYMNRFAISAKRAGPFTRLKKWIARNPAVAGGSIAVVLALGVAGFFAWQAKLDRDQLRAEQRQTAVDKAILEAVSGDATVALEAINEADNKGAEKGQVNLLRGVVEIHRGNPKEALLHLAQADQQLPDSVAVKALQAKAFLCSSKRFTRAWNNPSQRRRRINCSWA
jgi:serine/threonine protein kinase